MPDTKRLLSVLSMLLSLAIVVLALLQMSGRWGNAIYVLEPLLGVLMLLQAIRNWRSNRVVAILSLCIALLIFVIALWMYFGA